MYHENLIPAIVVEEDMYWEAGGYSPYDIYISPDATLFVEGGAYVNGDVINYGIIALAGEMEANDVYANDFKEYYDGMDIYYGDILDFGGGSVYSYGIQSILDLPSVPVHVYSDLQKNSAGVLPLLEGAILPIFDLRIEGQPITLEYNGSFTLPNYYAGSKTSLFFEITDFFEERFTVSYDLTEAAPKTLSSIEITQLPAKLDYKVGETLDLTGLMVYGNYSDSTRSLLTVTNANVTGFNSSVPMANQVLTVTVEGLQAYFPVNILPAANVSVFAGINRFDTARMVSAASYTTADTAILVLGTNFPDALAAGPLAYALNAPILLTHTNAIDPFTSQELERLQVRKVIIMGGDLVISPTVEAQLKERYQVQRIAGYNRYNTAVLAAQELKLFRGTPASAIITSGVDFADALSAGSYAAINGYPLVLTDGKAMTTENLNFLTDNGIKNVTIMGGEAIVSLAIENLLKNRGITVERIFGGTRADTSAAMANKYFANSNYAIAANGWTFADALSAIPYAARLNAPILLVRQNYVELSLRNYLGAAPIHAIQVVGGEIVVSVKVRNDLLIAIQ